MGYKEEKEFMEAILSEYYDPDVSAIKKEKNSERRLIKKGI